MAFGVPESRGHDDHLNAAALLTQAVKLGTLRQAVGRSGRPAAQAPFGDARPSRRYSSAGCSDRTTRAPAHMYQAADDPAGTYR
jgi:hypothetical protein